MNLLKNIVKDLKGESLPQEEKQAYRVIMTLIMVAAAIPLTMFVHPVLGLAAAIIGCVKAWNFLRSSD